MSAECRGWQRKIKILVIKSMFVQPVTVSFHTHDIMFKDIISSVQIDEDLLMRIISPLQDSLCNSIWDKTKQWSYLKFKPLCYEQKIYQLLISYHFTYSMLTATTISMLTIGTLCWNNSGVCIRFSLLLTSKNFLFSIYAQVSYLGIEQSYYSSTVRPF